MHSQGRLSAVLLVLTLPACGPDLSFTESLIKPTSDGVFVTFSAPTTVSSTATNSGWKCRFRVTGTLRGGAGLSDIEAFAHLHSASLAAYFPAGGEFSKQRINKEELWGTSDTRLTRVAPSMTSSTIGWTNLPQRDMTIWARLKYSALFPRDPGPLEVIVLANCI